MEIVMIGSGNVAHSFSHLLKLNGHQIMQVISKNEKHAQHLAEKLNTDYTSDFGKLYPKADIYILAVKDDAIVQIADTLQIGDSLIVHTAGAIDMNTLKKVSTNFGVLYPLQTLRKEDFNGKKIPLLIEGNSSIAINRLKALGAAISENIIEMDSQQRLKMHLTAIFCNNFPNHLATLCKSYCEQENLDFQLLTPLLDETLRQMKEQLKDIRQTGPARREDRVTMQKHQNLLKDYPDIQSIYQTLSASIQKFYNS